MKGNPVNWLCDNIFNQLNMGAHNNQRKFQGFLCLMNIAMSAWPLICYMLYTSDIHILFWLGQTPQYVNLAVPAMLLILNLSVTFFALSPNMSAKSSRIGCFGIFMLLGGIMLGAGAWVWMHTEKQVDILMHRCGEDSMTRRLDVEWTGLNAFYVKCDPKRKSVTEACLKEVVAAKSFIQAPEDENEHLQGCPDHGVEYCQARKPANYFEAGMTLEQCTEACLLNECGCPFE